MRRYQALTGLALLAVIAMVCACIAALAHSTRFSEYAERGELERFKAGRGLFMNRGGFIDFEDRVLLDEIPRADFSKGGIFFFGTSTMKWGMKTWELAPETRARVHNFGLGATNHRFVSQFIRHMVEQEGLLAAGGGNVHVVLACFWTMTNDWGAKGFFAQLWGRHGLFAYDPEKGIEIVQLGDLRRRLKYEQARLSAFVSVNSRRAVRAVATRAGMRMKSDAAAREDNPEIRGKAVEFASVPHWKQDLDREIEALREQIRYLRERKVRVTLVLLPTTIVYDGTPLPKQYQAALTLVAGESGVPLVDLSGLLAEDEYADLHHANYRGLGKVHEALMAVARSSLEKKVSSQR